MGHNPERMGVVSSVKDNERSCLPPVRLGFDGIICGGSVCILSGRCCESNRPYGV